MLNWFLPRVRSSAAVLAVLYAVCVGLSSIALPLPSAKAASHCLNGGENGGLEATAPDGTYQVTPRLGDRIPDDETGTSKSRDKSKCHVGACCAFFCFAAAVRGDPSVSLSPPVLAYRVFAAPDERPEGCGPERIGRPPKSLLSL
jgi:hypothetical protein